MTTRLTDRLTEMVARHIASTEAAERELQELQGDLSRADAIRRPAARRPRGLRRMSEGAQAPFFIA